MKKRGILSLLLVITMIISMFAFISCGKEEADVEITVHIKITSSNGDVLCDNDLLMTGIANEITILAATRRMCLDVLEIDFNYDAELDSVIQIGTDIFDEEKLAEIGDEENEAAAAVVDDNSYFDWQPYLNGTDVDIGIHTVLKAGDKIEWKWQKFIPEESKK